MSVLIGGDLVPTETNEDAFIYGKKTDILGDELASVIDSADYRIFNLEAPLADEASPIIKAGPALMAKTGTVAGIKLIGTDLLTLANNHILDQGVKGLDSTRRVLEKNGIQFVGVGDDIQEASKPFFFEQGENRFGVLACAEHEFSIAEKNTAGAYGFDPIESFDLVGKIKENCDYLIILYHGGKEYYRFPSPYLQKICRKMVDCGADLVVCQHSHCIGCEEKYKSGTIVYGQGNFIFDLQRNEFWNNGLLIKINDDKSITYIPIVQKENAKEIADAKTAQEIMDGFIERSEEIKKDGFIERKYQEFANESINSYLFMFSGKKKTFIYRVVNKLSGHKYEKWFIERKYRPQNLACLLNFIECEAHRELVLRGAKEKIK